MHNDNEFQNEEIIIDESDDASSIINDQEVLEDESIESVEENNNYVSHNKFGERDYNKARGTNGVYNKNYYSEKQKELDKKVSDAKERTSEKTKEETDFDENGNAKWKDGETPNNRTWENGKETTEGAPTKTVDKGLGERAKDQANLAKARIDALNNKISGAKAGVYNVAHPGEALKSKAKAAAGEAAKKGVSAIGKLIAAHPYVAITIGVIILFLILLLILIMVITTSTGGKNGYYDSTCDFNQSLVYCDGDDYDFKDYVVRKTYDYLDGDNYSENFAKAIMIIIKTNALAEYNYDTEEKYLDIGSCEFSKENYDDEMYTKLEEYYESVYENLFINSSFNGNNIERLDSSNALSFDDSIFVTLKAKYNNSNKDYTQILSEQYGSELGLYELNKSCEFFEFTEGFASSSGWWWPIGSSTLTQEGGKDFASGDPVSINITSTFGPRQIAGAADNHGAIDVGATCGTYIIASQAGTVEWAHDGCPTTGYYGSTCGGGYGNNVKITHNDGYSTLYAHMTQGSVRVKKGETVRQGQVIGLVGSSGSSTGCHLHFEVRINNTRVDPLDYVDPQNPRPIPIVDTDIGGGGSINISSDFDVHRTSLSKSAFVSKMNQYCARGCGGGMGILNSNAANIYDWGKKYNVNPELVVVRAEVEGFSPGRGYNYWGIGCTNTGGGGDCESYSSLEDGVKEFANTVSGYKSIFDFAKYAYIGQYWYNNYERNNGNGTCHYQDPKCGERWGVGGCSYFEHIKQFMSPSRIRIAERACSGTFCSPGRTSGCTNTTNEDQQAYAAWQVQVKMGPVRQKIFGH